MKKIICGLLFILTCGLFLASCSDDDNNETKHSTLPEVASAGTYTGTWSRAQITTDGLGDAETTTGTLTFAVPENTETTTKYVTSITANAAAFSFSKTSTANITWKQNGFLFSNQSIKNGFGVVFSGAISESGVATISFTITQKSGRKTYNYQYTFEGTKNSAE